MLTVAVAAHWSAGFARLHGFSVHAGKIGLGDVGMALPTGGGDIEVIDFGAGVLRGQYAVATMTIGAGCGSAVSIRDCASMHALPVKFHGMCEWNLVAC